MDTKAIYGLLTPHEWNYTTPPLKVRPGASWGRPGAFYYLSLHCICIFPYSKAKNTFFTLFKPSKNNKRGVLKPLFSITHSYFLAVLLSTPYIFANLYPHISMQTLLQTHHQLDLPLVTHQELNLQEKAHKAEYPLLL